MASAHDDPLTADESAPTRPEARTPSPGSPPRTQTVTGDTLTGERYEIRELIAQGGMGEVHLAWDRVLQREVAFKTLRADLDDETLAPRFAVEARVSGCLEHPNIVPVHDYGTGPDGRPFYTMRWIRGRSLGQLVAEGRLPSAVERLDVFRKVCDAIAFAHAEGVVHRDLKPNNVMVGEFGEVLVLDWGIARVGSAEVGGPPSRASESLADDSLQSPHTRAGIVVGTPVFMAPELLRGERERVDPRVDVYALGVMLYRLLTNVMPFSGERALHDARAGRFIRPRSRNQDVGRELDAIVRKAMALDPADRYATAAELRRDVQAYLEGGDVVAYPLGVVGRAMRWTRRNRRIVVPVGVTALLAAVALLIGGGFYARALATSRDRAVVSERIARDQAARAETASALSNIGAGRFEEAHNALGRARTNVVSAAVGAFTDLVEAYLLHQWTPPSLAWRFPPASTREFSLVVSPAGRKVLFSTVEGQMRAIGLPSGELLVERQIDHANATAGGFVDERPVVALATPGRAWLLDLVTGEELVAVTGAAPRIRIIDANGAFVMVDDGKQRHLLDVHTGAKRLWTLPADATIESVSNTATVAAGHRAAEFRMPDAYFVWDVHTGAQLHEFVQADRAQIDPAGRLVIVVDKHGAGLFDIATGALRHRWTELRPRNIVFDSDGSRVAFDHGDGTLSRWRVDPVALDSEQLFRANLRGVTADGALVVASADGWSVLAPTAPRGGAIALDGDPVHAAASADGVLACLASRDGRVRVFEPWTGSLLATFQGAPAPTGSRTCGFSPDATRLAQGDRDGVLRIWSTAQAEVVREIIGGDLVYDVAFTDEQHVIAGFGQGDIGTWNVDTGERTATFTDGPRGPWAIDLSHDGQSVIATGRLEGDPGLTVWHRDGGAPRFQVPTEHVGYGGVLSPSGRFAAIGTHQSGAMWWTIGDVTPTIAADQAEGVVMSVAFSPDEQLVFASSEQGLLGAWRRETGEKVGAVPLMPSDLGLLVLLPGTSTLLTVGSDRLRALDLGRPALAVAVTPASEVGAFVLPSAGERARQLGLHATMNGDWSAAHRWFGEALDAGAAPPALDRIRAAWGAHDIEATRRLLAAAARDGTITVGTAALWTRAAAGPIVAAAPRDR